MIDESKVAEPGVCLCPACTTRAAVWARFHWSALVAELEPLAVGPLVEGVQ